VEEEEGGKEVLVLGLEYRVEKMEKGDYDRVFRHGRVQMWEDIGWETWFRLGELLQGCP
jgi:hypothetical protein